MPHRPRKRVDVIVKYFYPVAGGIENNIMQTYKVLQSDFGWDVTIHTSADTYTQKDVLLAGEVIQTLKVKRYHHTSFGFRPDIDWATTDVVALHNFDVFFVRYLLRVLWLKVTKRKHFAFIVTPHGGFNPEWSVFSFFPRTLKQLYTYGMGSLLIALTTDRVRAVSDWEYKVLCQHLPKKIVEVIDNGLEDEAYLDVEVQASEEIKKQVRAYGRYIIQIGRVYPIKNYETTISALRYLPKDIKFVIIGEIQDQTYFDALQRQVQAYALENRVVFAGVIRGVDKYYILRHAIAMVHMALWESYGNVLREGMSQGLPCITSNVYNMPLLVRDGKNGFCLDVYDITGVADKILWILDTKHARALKEIREANIVLGSNQSWKEVARKMNVLYRIGIP